LLNDVVTPDIQSHQVCHADPPWRYRHAPEGDEGRSIEANYPSMALEEICALPVAEKVAAEDAILFRAHGLFN
jgi:N6-adenosine-specific RNA methylase IME4